MILVKIARYQKIFFFCFCCLLCCLNIASQSCDTQTHFAYQDLLLLIIAAVYPYRLRQIAIINSLIPIVLYIHCNYISAVP